jgi:hypothetical protein
VNGDQAYAFAFANAERNTAGDVVERSLVELVAHAIDFDAEKERLGKAQRIVAHRKRPGQTEPEGKVVIPGLEPYAYEPHRLVADDEGNLVENQHARTVHKQAEARRARDAAVRATSRAVREEIEAEQITEWTEAEQAKGRDQRALTWDACLRETSLWKDEEAESSDDEDADAEDGAA